MNVQKQSAMGEKNEILRSEVSIEKTEMQGKGEKEFVVKYRGKVYEISDFLKKHPGGSKILKPFKGLSLDDAMAENPHSEAAFHVFEEFKKENKEDYDSIEVKRKFTPGLNLYESCKELRCLDCIYFFKKGWTCAETLGRMAGDVPIVPCKLIFYFNIGLDHGVKSLN